MKIITLCGSLKFQKEMMIVAEKMALDGNCILTPVFPILEEVEKKEEQMTNRCSMILITNKNHQFNSISWWFISAPEGTKKQDCSLSGTVLFHNLA